MTLRKALTPSPRYMRAMPSKKGFGALGSGPVKYVITKYRGSCDASTSDETVQCFQRSFVRCAGQSALLDLGLHSAIVAYQDQWPFTIGKCVVRTHPRDK